MSNSSGPDNINIQNNSPEISQLPSFKTVEVEGMKFNYRIIRIKINGYPNGYPILQTFSEGHNALKNREIIGLFVEKVREYYEMLNKEGITHGVIIESLLHLNPVITRYGLKTLQDLNKSREKDYKLKASIFILDSPDYDTIKKIIRQSLVNLFRAQLIQAENEDDIQGILTKVTKILAQ